MPQKARRKNSGKRKDGRFRAKLVVGYSKDGNPKYKYFYSTISKVDCERKLQEYIAAHDFEDPEEPTISGNITLEQWQERWMKSYKVALAPATKAQYEQVSKIICDYRYYGTRFGSMPLKAFLPIHLAEYMNSLAGNSKSWITINRITLKGLFSTACENALIERDVSIKLPKVKGTYEGHKALTQDEIKLVSNNWHYHRAGLGIMIMLWAGLRKGEACALQWEDIDLENGIIHVRKAWDPVHAVLKDTKTVAGQRDVPIFAKLRTALESEKKDSGLVFTTADGCYHTYSSLDRAIEGFIGCMERVLNGVPNPGYTNVRTDVWKKRAALANKEWKKFHFSPHDLRTTFATMCYDAKVDMHTTARWMGHTNVETTLGIYTKLTNERKIESTNAMDEYSRKMDNSETE